MHRHRAQSIIEFAIVAPFLVLFALGILDFGRVFYANIGLVNAAREGARVAVSLSQDDPTYTTTVKTAVSAVPIDLFSGAIPLGSITVGPAYNDRRTVSVDYSFQPVTPFIGDKFGDPATGLIPLYATATFPVVNQ